MSSTIPADGGPLTSRQIEQILQKHKEIMLEVNLESVSIQDIKTRLQQSEIVLAKAKQRSFGIELTLHEMIEIILIFMFTKGDLIENKTTPEILLKSIQRLVTPLDDQNQNFEPNSNSSKATGRKISKSRAIPMDETEALERERKINKDFNAIYALQKAQCQKIQTEEK